MAEQQKPPFLGRSEQDLSARSQHAVTRAYPKNTIILNAGDETNSLNIILAGEVDRNPARANTSTISHPSRAHRPWSRQP